jgi:hypothetical protein
MQDKSVILGELTEKNEEVVEMMARWAGAITFILSKQNQIQNITGEQWAVQLYI